MSAAGPPRQVQSSSHRVDNSQDRSSGNIRSGSRLSQGYGKLVLRQLAACSPGHARAMYRQSGVKEMGGGSEPNHADESAAGRCPARCGRIRCASPHGIQEYRGALCSNSRWGCRLANVPEFAGSPYPCVVVRRHQNDRVLDSFDGHGGLERDPAPRVERRRFPTAADAVAALDASWDAVQSAIAAVPEPRWWRKREVAKALDVWRDADRDFQSASERITHARVGDVPGEWGLLSDDIESTLDRYVNLDIGEELRERLNAIHSQVFKARLLAHGGDRSLEEALTQDLAQCLDLEPSDERARRLVHHLPGWARPIPEVDMHAVAHTLASHRSVSFDKRYFDYRDPVSAISWPRFPLKTCQVTFKTIDTLELHDIIAEQDPGSDYRPSRSAGLGSAALEHLCRSADHYGLSIFGMIMPGDRTEVNATRLADWYGRHHFDIAPRIPGEFLCATVRRAPRAVREDCQ